MAWKLGTLLPRPPHGTDTLVYAGGDYRFCGSKECPVGSTVTLNVVLRPPRWATPAIRPAPAMQARRPCRPLRTATVAAMGAGLVLTGDLGAPRTGSATGSVHRHRGRGDPAELDLTATDGNGQVGRTLVGAVAAGGRITASWDGLTDAGTAAPSGAYTLRLSSDGPTAARASRTGATVTLARTPSS